MQWHSVDDALPISNGYKALVTVRRCKGLVADADPYVSIQTTAIWVQGRWLTEQEGDEVTHWVALPEIPLAD